MKNPTFPRTSRWIFTLLVVIFLGTGCIPSALQPEPVVQTAEVTRQVTVEVTRQVIQEVTRLVEIPVTITPTFTPELVLTPTLESATTSPTGVALVRLKTGSLCYYGPSMAYLTKYTLAINTQMEAYGRSIDGLWINVRSLDQTKLCWLQLANVEVGTGDPAALPVLDPVLTPYSVKYKNPLAAVSTNRVGNEVSVFWLPIAMTESEYRGYLIEAWVCQGGQQVFIARSHVPAYASNQNIEMQAVLFIDEPGCTLPSRARIYAVEKNGYSMPNYMSWPPAVLPTATP